MVKEDFTLMNLRILMGNLPMGNEMEKDTTLKVEKYLRKSGQWII